MATAHSSGRDRPWIGPRPSQNLLLPYLQVLDMCQVWYLKAENLLCS